jgi:hypothetical protein
MTPFTFCDNQGNIDIKEKKGSTNFASNNNIIVVDPHLCLAHDSDPDTVLDCDFDLYDGANVNVLVGCDFHFLTPYDERIDQDRLHQTPYHNLFANHYDLQHDIAV